MPPSVSGTSDPNRFLPMFPITKQDMMDAIDTRDSLEIRIQKGKQIVAEILAATDPENPRYQEQKNKLDGLIRWHDAIEIWFWIAWEATDARILFGLPKTLKNLPLIGGKTEKFPDGLSQLFAIEDELYIYSEITFTEYKTIILPLVTMDSEPA